MRYQRLTEQARPPLDQGPPLVAVAHGSKDPRAAATIGELIAAVRTRLPGTDVRAAFLDHSAPSLPQVLAALAPDGPARYTCVTVPLLLSDAYHGKSDVPAQFAAARSLLVHKGLPRLDVTQAATLGPHPRLLDAMERRLREAGVDPAEPGTSVILASAGSSDHAARAAVTALAARWARTRGGWHSVLPAFASAAGPRPAEAVRAARDSGAARVVVATYLLAPGRFADKIRAAALAAGADAVSGVLGAAPEVADAVAGRYADAVLDCDGASSVTAGPGVTKVSPPSRPRSAVPKPVRCTSVADPKQTVVVLPFR